MLNKKLPYAVELDGGLTFCSGGRFSELEDLRQVDEDCCVVSDLQGAVARTMTVEADPRYVELMISKKFQETGEFDEPVTVISHWKKKQGKNTTDIFFTALPSRRYFQYVEMVGQSGHHLLILPLHAVMLSALRKNCAGQPAAVVFQHDRFADMIVGTDSKVWYANRVVAFDSSTEQIDNLWETIRTDVLAAGQDHRQSIKKIFVMTWLAGRPMPRWESPEAPVLIPLAEETVRQADPDTKASLPVMMRMTKTSETIATKRDKLYYGARRLLPYSCAVLILLSLVCLLGTVFYQQRAAGLRNRITALQHQAIAMKDKGAGSSTMVDYKPTLNLLQQLQTARSLPGYGQLLHDFSTGLGDALRLSVFKADYLEGKVEIEVFGTARAPFDISYKAYQMLQEQLRRRGYTINAQHFDTRINLSDFTLQCVKDLK